MASPSKLARGAVSATLALSLLGTAAPAAWAQAAVGGSGSGAEAQAADGEAQTLATDWQVIGTCEWRVDESGCLTIRPANGVSGEFGLSGDYNGAPWFDVRESITSVTVVDGVSATGSLSYLFSGCTSLASLDLSGLDTSSVTSMRYMFYFCTSLASVDLSSFDTSSVTDMGYMFYRCESLASLDLSSFDASSVTDMGSMFALCASLTSLDLSGLDTSSVTDMGSMFAWCPSLVSVDLSGWDTSSVTDMSFMFQGCSSLASLDLSGLDTSSVMSMYGMFYGCTSLDSLDLSGFDTSSVTSMSHMFRECSSLSSLDLSGFDTSSVTDTAGMFYGCTSLCVVALGEGVTSDVASVLPSPSADYIAGADGYWHASSGGAYLPEDIPTGAADVYYAVVFTDVDYSGATEWGCAAEWATRAASLGLMTGYRDPATQEPTGEFGPADRLTRGQAAVVLYRAITGAADDEAWEENATPSVEADVVEPNYYTNALNWAYASGVMTGDTDPATGAALNTFRPGDTVTRQELAIMVWRAAGSPGAADGGAAYAACADAGDEWEAAADALRWTASADVLSGSVEAGGTYLNASDDALRAHAAKIFVQALPYLAG